MTTDEIRKIVTRELRSRDGKAAKWYESVRRLAAKKAIDAAIGTARLTEESMQSLNLEAGDPIELMYGDKRHTVRVERATIGRKEIQLSTDDLRRIGAKEGTQIAVRRGM